MVAVATERDADNTRRDRIVVALSLVSGATDAIGFVMPGGAFSSVMTGNMVLLGLSAGTHDGSLAAHSAAAVIAFVAGCAAGSRIAGSPRPGDPVWPPAVTRALVAEAAVLLVYAAGFEATASFPRDDLLQTALLALTAMALGIQSSAIQRFGVPGLSTTYLTGTLTTTVIRLMSGRPVREVGPSFHLLVALILGAAVGGIVCLHAARFAPALQLVGVMVAILVPWRAGATPQSSSLSETLTPT